jgi:hypothetical protein
LQRQQRQHKKCCTNKKFSRNGFVSKFKRRSKSFWSAPEERKKVFNKNASTSILRHEKLLKIVCFFRFSSHDFMNYEFLMKNLKNVLEGLENKLEKGFFIDKDRN